MSPTLRRPSSVRRHLEELGDVCNTRQEHNNLGGLQHSRFVKSTAVNQAGKVQAQAVQPGLASCCTKVQVTCTNRQEVPTSRHASYGAAAGQELRERDGKSPPEVNNITTQS